MEGVSEDTFRNSIGVGTGGNEHRDISQRSGGDIHEFRSHSGSRNHPEVGHCVKLFCANDIRGTDNGTGSFG
jgi:hypothetical protein